MDDVKIKTAEKVNDTDVKEVSSGETSSKTSVDEVTKPNSNKTKKPSEQDLDAFLLGDIEDGDDGPGTLMNLCEFLTKLVLATFAFLFLLEMDT